MKLSRPFAALTCLLGVFLIGPSGGTAQDLNFHATGKWRDDVQGAGDWTADLALLGDSLSGVITVGEHPELKSGTISGSATGTALTMVMRQGGIDVATFSGSFSDNAIIGKFQTGTGATGNWAGSWRADPPQVVQTWPSDVQLVDPVAVEPRLPRVSGVKRHATVPAPVSVSLLERGRQWIEQTVAAFGDTMFTQAFNHLVDAAFAAVTVGANVLVNNSSDSGNAQNEPDIAISRVNNQKIAAGANDYSISPGNARNGYYFSTDGGATWPSRGQVPGLSTSYSFGGDPWLDSDASGNFFDAGIAFNSGASTSNAIFVAKALATDASYQNAKMVATSPSDTTAFLDQPQVAVNRVSGTTGFGNIYVCWTRLTNEQPDGTFLNGEIRLAVSTDGGSNFNMGGIKVSDDNDSDSCTLAVSIDGDVNIVWLRNGNQLVMDTCTNGGTTCGTDQLIANITPLPGTLPGLQFDVTSHPQLAIDNEPSGNGYKAIVWADYRNSGASNADIYFTFAQAHGSWITPKAIASTTTDEFFPTITIDTNHLQQVLYYRRTSQSGNTFNTFIILSGNGTGNFSTPVQLNDGGNIIPATDPTFIGDYIGLDGVANRQPGWMDSRRTIPGSSDKQQDIYTATVSGC